MKDFDYNKAKAGAKVCTRVGGKAEIIYWDSETEVDGRKYPIVALYEDVKNDGIIRPETYGKDGRAFVDEDDCDLMMADIKREGYVLITNRESNDIGGTCYLHDEMAYRLIYKSEQDAIADAQKFGIDYIAVAHIEWEE